MNTSAIGKSAWGVGAAGLLALILSFLPWYATWSWEGFYGDGGSDGFSAWHSYATVGILLVVAAVGVVAVDVFVGAALPKGLPLNLIAAGVAAVGTLLLVLRAVTWGASIGFGTFGPGWSAYALWAASLAVVVFSALRARESGEKVEGAQLKGLADRANQAAASNNAARSGAGPQQGDRHGPAPQAQPTPRAQYGEQAQYGQQDRYGQQDQFGPRQHGQQQYGPGPGGYPAAGGAQGGGFAPPPRPAAAPPQPFQSQQAQQSFQPHQRYPHQVHRQPPRPWY